MKTERDWAKFETKVSQLMENFIYLDHSEGMTMAEYYRERKKAVMRLHDWLNTKLTKEARVRV